MRVGVGEAGQAVGTREHGAAFSHQKGIGHFQLAEARNPPRKVAAVLKQSIRLLSIGAC